MPPRFRLLALLVVVAAAAGAVLYAASSGSRCDSKEEADQLARDFAATYARLATEDPAKAGQIMADLRDLQADRVTEGDWQGFCRVLSRAMDRNDLL